MDAQTHATSALRTCARVRMRVRARLFARLFACLFVRLFARLCVRMRLYARVRSWERARPGPVRQATCAAGGPREGEGRGVPGAPDIGIEVWGL